MKSPNITRGVTNGPKAHIIAGNETRPGAPQVFRSCSGLTRLPFLMPSPQGLTTGPNSCGLTTFRRPIGWRPGDNHEHQISGPNAAAIWSEVLNKQVRYADLPVEAFEEQLRQIFPLGSLRTSGLCSWIQGPWLRAPDITTSADPVCFKDMQYQDSERVSQPSA